MNLMENRRNTTIVAERREKRQVKVGDLFLGGGSPIAVQSMTNVPTREVDVCLEQIGRLVKAGCEIVRVSVPTADDTAVLPELIRNCPVPLVADVHFHYVRALEAIEAGVAKIRLNPGNIRDRRQVEEVIDACKANGTAIRVGVNQGSIRNRKDSAKDDLIGLMMSRMVDYVQIFERKGFENLVLSAKCHDVVSSVLANRAASERFDYPLHLGVTHSGTVHSGTIRSSLALGRLLSEGIGDTIRVSLAGDPVLEVKTAWEILASLQLRRRSRPEIIVCPTCGRTEIDLLAMARQVEEALEDIPQPIKVAVMGCVVNGPGEAAEADVALCGGREKAAIYRCGELVASVKAELAVGELLKQVQIYLGQAK